MARLTVIAAIAVALLGRQDLPAQQPAPSRNDTARIDAWFEKKYEEQLAFSPIQQTFLGRKSAAIDDLSIAAQDRQLAWQRASVAEMKKGVRLREAHARSADLVRPLDLPVAAGGSGFAVPDQRLRLRPDVGHPRLLPSAARRLPPGR